MLLLAIKKIINNRILMLSLFAGILVAILIACTIPIYSQGISHRMLVTKLENYQSENNVSPGAVVLSTSLATFGQSGDDEIVDKYDSSANVKNYDYCTSYLKNDLYKKLHMPALVESITLSSPSMVASDHRDYNQSTVADVIVKATDSYTNAIELVCGRMPSSNLDANGCVEVIISTATQENTRFTVGSVINIGNTKESTMPNSSDIRLTACVVGVFNYTLDPLNPIIDKDTGCELYCDFELFYNYAFKEKNIASRATWYYAGDYTKYDLTKIEETIDALDELNDNLRAWGIDKNAKTTIPPFSEYQSYYENVQSVNVLLALFYSPVLILIVFFIFMISKFVVENDKNEISMLNSRGSSRKQIVLLYLLQGGTIALVCLIFAPILALLLCKMLGTASGFLEFAQRAPLKSELSISAIIFAVVAAVLAVVTMLVPVYKASKVEIIQHKRRNNTNGHLGTIILSIVTLLLAAVSAYSYYNLVYQSEGLITEGGGIQPLAYVFLISAFATIALIFVIIYPFVLKFILKLGQRSWTPSIYSAFSKISKLETKEKFIIIFLTLTIAIGAFASVSARTLNNNFDRSTQYQYPCDVIADIEIYARPGSNTVNRRFVFEDVEGIQATKVVKGNSPRINSRLESITENIDLLAINPKEFGEIVDWDNDILKKPLKYYLNELEADVNTCVLSENAANLLGVTDGDTVYVRVDTTSQTNAVVTARVIAVVNAWPAYNPTTSSTQGVVKDNYLCVLNIEAVEKMAQNQPYSVWMNMDEEYSSWELEKLTVTLGATAEKQEDRVSARMKNIVNGARERYFSKIDSNRQAVNGSLTLGFIAIIFVCAIGLMIYWMISIKSRTLQIGTMRALGMSFKDVYEMILWEQVLLCLASVVIGIFSGLLAGALFAPLLQSAFGQMGQMPPYEVAFSFVDIIKLIILTIVLIGVSLGAGTIMLKRIKAATAIKLGEE